MTWHEWIEFRFDNRTDKDITIANLKSEFGWSYRLGDGARIAIEDSKMVGFEILKKSDDNGFGHRGRAGAMSGTEGSFDLTFKGESKKLGHVYWNCPYWSSINTFTLTEKIGGSKYVIDYIGGSSYGSSIGGVLIRIKQLTP